MIGAAETIVQFHGARSGASLDHSNQRGTGHGGGLSW